MDRYLRESFEVNCDYVDNKGTLSLNGIARAMQVVAEHHAGIFNIDVYKNINNDGIYCIISRVKFYMETYPKWGEKFEIETYIGGYDGLYTVRLFDIYDAYNHKIGHVIGDYLFMDINKKRPIRLKDNQGTLPELERKYIGERLKKLALPEEVQSRQLRRAYYSEMDLNDHMNNTHYVKWCIDMLPLEVLKTKRIVNLQINYNAAIACDEEVLMSISHISETLYIVTGDHQTEGKNYFIAKIEVQ